MNQLTKYISGIIIVVILIMIALPQLLSTRYVKQRIAGQLTHLTGRTVKINGESSISLRPYLAVSYDNVNIGGKSPSTDKPLVTIETLRARLAVMSALWGDAKLSELELIRPKFNLLTDDSGSKNWLFEKGGLAESLAASPDAPQQALHLGKLKVVDGIVEIHDELQHTTQEITALNGEFIWDDTQSPASATMKAIWRGKNFVLEAGLDKPLDALRGGMAKLQVRLTSNPLNVNFSGNVNTEEFSAEGTLSASSSSLMRLTEWLQHPIPAAAYLGPSSIAGQINLKSNKFEFQETKVVVDGHPGTGRLQLFITDKHLPSVSGTLAFDTINLPFAAKVSVSDDAGQETKSDFSLFEGFHLDLRLSANEVTGAPVNLQDFAASIIVRDADATIDIAHADIMGGELIGSMTLNPTENKGLMSANVQMSNIALEQFSKLHGPAAISLDGVGNASIKLSSIGKSYSSWSRRLSGEGKISSREGTIIGIDLNDILEGAEQQSEQVWRSLDGSTSYDQLDISFKLTNGTTLSGSGLIRGTGLETSLSGRGNLTKGSLAMRGKIDKTDENGEKMPESGLPFFVGGTATSPLFVPLSTPSTNPNEN